MQPIKPYVNNGATNDYNKRLLARGYYTIQSITEVPKYEAELISSVGTLISSSVDNITIDLHVYNEYKDITNKFNKFVWKRYIYDYDTPVIDPSWSTEETTTQIQISSADFFAKVKFEVEVYEIPEGKENEEVVARVQIVLTDVNDMNASDTPPTPAKEGMIWLNTSTNPPTFWIFKNGEWVQINDNGEIYEDIDKLIKDLQDLETSVGNLKDEISNSITHINNTKDFLFEYFNSLTSTNGVHPKPGYKCTLHTNKGKFRNCVLVSNTQTSIIKYDKKILDLSTNFTINVWINPDINLTNEDNSCRLISLGKDITTSFMTIWNDMPTKNNTQNRRLVVEFGTDDIGNAQSKQLVSSTPFKYNTWEMLTITYEKETKQISFYRNGELWTFYEIKKENNIEYFAIEKAGWYLENLCILNNQLLTADEIKDIYKKNIPFKDMLPRVIEAPAPVVTDIWVK